VTIASRVPRDRTRPPPILNHAQDLLDKMHELERALDPQGPRALKRDVMAPETVLEYRW